VKRTLRGQWLRPFPEIPSRQEREPYRQNELKDLEEVSFWLLTSRGL
jgi:hypothetical protein